MPQKGKNPPASRKGSDEIPRIFELDDSEFNRQRIPKSFRKGGINPVFIHLMSGSGKEIRMKTWKAVVGAMVLIAGVSPVHAGIPHAINLEGRLTDSSGNPILSATPVEFRLFQGGDAGTADSGNLVYRELSTITPGPEGTYTHLL